MRSRFAAYVKGGSLAVRYVCGTTHPDNEAAQGSKRPDGTPASTLAEDVAATCKSVTFLRLKLRDVEKGSSEDEGFVTFQVGSWPHTPPPVSLVLVSKMSLLDTCKPQALGVLQPIHWMKA